MGIGLVDPILPALASGLHATPSQVSLLFTSYLVVTAVAMLVVGWVSSRIGAKPTLAVGLILIVVFAALAGTSNSIGGIVGSAPAGAWATPCSSRPASPSSWPRPAAASPGRSSCTRPR
jgi:MFS family permease